MEAGAEHIKIVPTGIINFAKGAVVAAPQFQSEEIRQFKIASTQRDKHLMAHASGEVGIGYAIDGEGGIADPRGMIGQSLGVDMHVDQERLVGLDGVFERALEVFRFGHRDRLDAGRARAPR